MISLLDIDKKYGPSLLDEGLVKYKSIGWVRKYLKIVREAELDQVLGKKPSDNRWSEYKRAIVVAIREAFMINDDDRLTMDTLDTGIIRRKRWNELKDKEELARREGHIQFAKIPNVVTSLLMEYSRIACDSFKQGHLDEIVYDEDTNIYSLKDGARVVISVATDNTASVRLIKPINNAQ